MFEDSTFESTGRIKTRSRRWAIAALTFNGSILLLLVLIPLIFPQALERQAMTFLMQAPPPPVQQQPPPQPPAHIARPASEMPDGQLVAPVLILDQIYMARDAEPALVSTLPGWDTNPAGGENPGEVFRQQRAVAVVRQVPKAPVRISSAIEAGLLMEKTVPIYPPIGKAIHAQGTVVLTATISKVGTIENLRVVSGPPILQQSALDAVKTWRYKPYLLDGEPVEVETTVNVIFTLGQ